MTLVDFPMIDRAFRRLGAEPALDLLRRELERRWPPGTERVQEIARHALLPAGKLLRPLLLLESAAAVGGDPREVVAAALGIEYLHVASLIHDDIIDGDDIRRGRPSMPARYGATDALVAGDALILHMFAAVADCAGRGVPADRVLAAVRVLAEAGVDLCRGQAMEAESRGDVHCGLRGHLAVMSLKTGAMFRGACRSGAILGGGSPGRTEAVSGFGEHLGLAFQMHDDILAYAGDAQVTGKPGASDVVNRRPTFPVVVGYEAAGPRDRRRIEAALAGGLPAAQAYDLMRDALRSAGALRLAREHAERQVALAKERLSALPDTESTAVLMGIADLAIERDR